MGDVGSPTLDQPHALLTVAESGSFSEAARRLGRSISVTSQAGRDSCSRLAARRASSRPISTCVRQNGILYFTYVKFNGAARCFGHRLQLEHAKTHWVHGQETFQ